MTRDSWIAQVKESVDEHLRAFFQRKRHEARELSGESEELVEVVETLTMRGGKRLRPAVLVAAYEATAGTDGVQRSLDAGAALELLQSYLLIHDDWMDEDDERRGGPSVHAIFRERLGNAHLGASLAVLSGDLASAYAWELLFAAPWTDSRRRQAADCFVQTQKEVLFGQQLDLTAHPDTARMHQLKTGSYTVRGPLRLGALLGNATERQLEALDGFGHPLGEAFQLRDDLLGTFGDSSTTGKPAGNDLRAGKHTSLVAEARRVLSEDERRPLEFVLGNLEAGDEDVAHATELLVSSGARHNVEARLEGLAKRALGALDDGLFHARGLSRLREVAERLAVRSH